jgi:biotin/methionine sulfoxide reductase
MPRTRTTTHWGTYDAVTRDGRVVAVEPVPGDPEPSAIGPGMPAALYDEARIARPAVRQGWLEHGPRRDDAGRGAEPFVEVPWDEALDLAAAELARVAAEHGNAAIYGGSYGWASAGRFHHAQSQLHRFLNLHGGYTASVNSYSAAALEVVLPHVIGGTPWSVFDRMPLWDELAEHGELIVAFGGLATRNAQVNAGGVAVHGTAAAQGRLRAAGVAIVNVSPLRDDVEAGEWLAPRPGTDVALMLGLAHTLVAEGLHDAEFLARCCVGFERFRAYLEDGHDADWAARVTGLDAGAIVALARRIASSRTLIAVSLSLQRARFGEQPCWMGAVLAAMSGSLGRSGGGFGMGYAAGHSFGMSRGRWPVAALPQGRNPVGTRIPVARIADALLEPGTTIDYDGERLTFPDIRLVYWCGGNPFHHHQDLNRLARAWRRPETVIAHEPWWNPLARHADIVLPVATALEREDVAAGTFEARILAMHRAAEAPGEARTDFAAFTGLAERLGFGTAFTERRDERGWVRHLYEETRRQVGALPPFEEFWAAGEAELPPYARRARGDWAALRADPAAHPLETPSGRLEIFSDAVAAMGYEDCPGHPVWLEPEEWAHAARFPLHLISPQPATRLHGQYDNGAHSRAGKVAGREALLLHPHDAAVRGIADGDVVRVFNARGACLAGAVVSDAIARGVVRLPTGAWYDPAEPGGLERHGNPNVLTLDAGTSRLAQGPSAGTALVEVERFAGADPPPVGAFAPPRLAQPKRDR